LANSFLQNFPTWLTASGTVFIGIVGLISTVILSWRKEIRDQQNNNIQNQADIHELERRKLDAEIAKHNRMFELEQRKFEAEIANHDRLLDLEQKKLEAENQINRAKLSLEQTKLDFEKSKHDAEQKKKGNRKQINKSTKGKPEN